MLDPRASFSERQSDSQAAPCHPTTVLSGLSAPGSTPWFGIGHVAVGMHRQGYDLQLTQYDDRGWRATFHTTGMEHPPVSGIDTGWQKLRGMQCR